MIEFTKMHGLSNDFVVVDGPWDDDPELVRSLCDRRRGIGADGMLAVSDGGDRAAVRMQYWNADGSSAEMCGNGLRCVAAYARDRGLVDADEFTVDTPAGVKEVILRPDGLIAVDLGPVAVDDEPVSVVGRSWTVVDVGNPHVVGFVDDVESAPVSNEGRVVAVHELFPDGTNVEYVRVDGSTVTMRVWERGVGETLACGSGMVAAAAAARQASSGDEWTVRVRGGEASVRFEPDHVWLIGPAATVFSGSWPAQ